MRADGSPMGEFAYSSVLHRDTRQKQPFTLFSSPEPLQWIHFVCLLATLEVLVTTPYAAYEDIILGSAEESPVVNRAVIVLVDLCVSYQGNIWS